MFKNYLKIAYRNFSKNKFYSIINITGLSIGLACTLLILLFVTDEMNVDTFHENNDQLHAVAVERTFGEQSNKTLITQYPLGRSLVEEIPQVEMSVTTTPVFSGKLSVDGETFTTESRVMASSSDFFSMFNFPLISGNAEQVLLEPGTVVITEAIADKYFPRENPIGKTLIVDRYGKYEYTITGIAENSKKNSLLKFDVVISIQGLSSTKSNQDSWGSSMYRTYARFQDNTNVENVNSAANQAMDVHLGERRAKSTDFFFVPITELYLSDLVRSSGFKGSYTYIYIFSAIALFILALGSINYMNLSTARGMQRGREVGVRKVLGAGKKQLVQQFIGEAIIISLFSLVLAFFIAELSLPFFNDFFGKELSLNFVDNIQFITGLFLVTILFGALSGTYPALFLSRFKPSQILKSQGSIRIGGVNLRKSLVVFQFTVSTVLIVSTLVISKQLSFLLDKDLGFDKNQTLYIPFNTGVNIDPFKQSLENHQSVLFVSHSNGVPGSIAFSTRESFDAERPDEVVAAHVIAADENYDEALNLDLLAGSFFDSKKAAEQSNAVVINEAMQKWMNWTTADEAIGKTFKQGDEIIGVVKDFHFRSLREEISPVIMSPITAESSTFSGNDMLVVRFQPEQMQGLLEFMTASWKETVSSEPIQYTFLDDQMDRLYRTDRKLGSAFSFFAGIGIFIACLGLFGLTAFSAERRTKEIGIRKVLGATVSSIIGLLSKDFMTLVAIGFVVATPIAWYIMSTWLTEFAYRVDVGVEVFLVAGVASLVVAGITTSWQSIKAATINPSNSLRGE